MGRGDEQATVAKLRSDLRRLYGEHAETVLSFMLRTYRHGGTEAASTPCLIGSRTPTSAVVPISGSTRAKPATRWPVQSISAGSA
jgi:hypothetical protein